jgi:hypothetical protein
VRPVLLPLSRTRTSRAAAPGTIRGGNRFDWLGGVDLLRSVPRGRLEEGVQRFRWWQGAVERQPAHSGGRAQQFGDAVAGFGWWNGAHGRSLQSGCRSRPRPVLAHWAGPLNVMEISLAARIWANYRGCSRTRVGYLPAHMDVSDARRPRRGRLVIGRFRVRVPAPALASCASSADG